MPKKDQTNLQPSKPLSPHEAPIRWEEDSKQNLTCTILSPMEEGEAFKATYGLAHPMLNTLLLNHLSSALPAAYDNNILTAYFHESQPKSPQEAMLLGQMLAVHNMTLAMVKGFKNNTYLEPSLKYANAMGKLSKTFTAQMEALHKLRHGGQQTVLVQHVKVSDGGQAIVGQTLQRGGL
jgi:hypothetical protein